MSIKWVNLCKALITVLGTYLCTTWVINIIIPFHILCSLFLIIYYSAIILLILLCKHESCFMNAGVVVLCLNMVLSFGQPEKSGISMTQGVSPHLEKSSPGVSYLDKRTVWGKVFTGMSNDTLTVHVHQDFKMSGRYLLGWEERCGVRSKEKSKAPSCLWSSTSLY